ncbi:MAG: hypothetical protein C4B57_11790 [Deltaproteobacteria bacterium]|nr:MAG: hypothetical protein C4B57_11790 [Deltaproteobacteria bacterium]
MSSSHSEDLFTETTDSPGNGRPKILVVDDDQSLREFLEILLAKEGYRVWSAPSGQKALQLMDRENISLVISDVRMPGIDGMTLLKKIKTRHADVRAPRAHSI